MAKVWVWNEDPVQKVSLLRAIEALGHEANGCSNMDDVVPLCRSGLVGILLIDTALRGPAWGLEVAETLRRYTVRVGNDLHPYMGLLIADKLSIPLSAAAFRMRIPLIRRNDWRELAYWLTVFDEMITQDQKDELLVSIFHT